MSLADYLYSREAATEDAPFYGIIMHAMRRADTANLEQLKMAFPDTWHELRRRYNAAGGILPEEEG